MTEKQFTSYLKKVKREIRRIGGDLVPIDSVRFVHRTNPVGLCLYYDGPYPFCTLEFADVLLQLDEISIHETIAHELLSGGISRSPPLNRPVRAELHAVQVTEGGDRRAREGGVIPHDFPMQKIPAIFFAL